MNIVALIGNAATEPVLKYTPTGKTVCTFRIAVSRPGAEEADFFSVVTWERQAEVVSEYVTVGRRVAITGALHHSVLVNHLGERRSHVEVIATKIELLGRAAAPAPDPEVVA
jgi:single-strand DNA-binding protein